MTIYKQQTFVYRAYNHFWNVYDIIEALTSRLACYLSMAYDLMKMLYYCIEVIAP